MLAAKFVADITLDKIRKSVESDLKKEERAPNQNAEAYNEPVQGEDQEEQQVKVRQFTLAEGD